jgi:hypothetical protein
MPMTMTTEELLAHPVFGRCLRPAAAPPPPLQSRLSENYRPPAPPSIPEKAVDWPADYLQLTKYLTGETRIEVYNLTLRCLREDGGATSPLSDWYEELPEDRRNYLESVFKVGSWGYKNTSGNALVLDLNDPANPRWGLTWASGHHTVLRYCEILEEEEAVDVDELADGSYVIAGSFSELLTRLIQEERQDTGFPYFMRPEFEPKEALFPWGKAAPIPLTEELAKEEAMVRKSLAKRLEEFPGQPWMQSAEYSRAYYARAVLNRSKAPPPKPPKHPAPQVEMDVALAARLEAHEAVEYTLRTPEERVAAPNLEKLLQRRLKGFDAAALPAGHREKWEQLVAFHQRHGGLRAGGFLFGHRQPPALEYSVVQHFYDDREHERDWPHYKLVFPLGDSVWDGYQCVAIDLHPDRFGWIGFYWHEGFMTDGDYPVVAHSLNEFLTATMDGYERGWRFYWDDPEWRHLGQTDTSKTDKPVCINDGTTWVEERRGNGADI